MATVRNQRAPRGARLHIGIFGRRNGGKSSLLNALAGQDVALVSPLPGTTTDPVEKPFELRPLGPVVFVDTAGLDDAGDLGALRRERSRRVLDRADVTVLVAAEGQWEDFEQSLLDELRGREVPVVVAFTKCDLARPDAGLVARLRDNVAAVVVMSAATGEGLPALREALLAAAPADFVDPPAIVSDLVGPGELAVLVAPIDSEAPVGRLILPQVQAIRDLLDGDACCLVVKPSGLREALGRLATPPRLVVTDSQAFREAAAATPPDVPLTSFSILFARAKGDLAQLALGSLAIDRLRPGARILIAEACSHHAVEDDIGRVKIPAWLAGRVGGELRVEHAQGRDFPADLAAFDLVVHCGSCMLNRREVLSRLLRCREAGVPITNYGVAIAHCLGTIERALAPFPAVLDLWRRERDRVAG
ncbi:MAG TPA: [FeFe] hydrogenase H-cluster maturation GTPase HydF [Candidatus Krumholzibacteria bacterium]|nr:[FeFe] hydrogenase H-cluster maturation GTPase HydF [Candidatus Krumholzibacteria bacterium]HPD73074.1 [FeFe] hydrogenase H-cluster maturation GTPase HydF [Candidatus Krumholzibacteria bacterium]HRY41874.1 [FeFe] hydrogenase H-cluster maturation GTPase HydF [Candidatus Krumholzibacteria bacterium]